MRYVQAAALGALACNVDDDGKNDGPYCDDTVTGVALDEMTPLGFAADQILLLVPPTEQSMLAWATGGTTDLSLAFRPATTARFVASTAVYPEGTSPAIGVVCDDRVEIDVQLDLGTADGAFAETLNSVLRALTVEGGEITEELDLDHLAGTFDIDPFTSGDEYDERRAWVTITIGGGPTSGVIEGQVSGGDPCDPGDVCTAWAEEVDIATWNSPTGASSRGRW